MRYTVVAYCRLCNKMFYRENQDTNNVYKLEIDIEKALGTHECRTLNNIRDRYTEYKSGLYPNKYIRRY